MARPRSENFALNSSYPSTLSNVDEDFDDIEDSAPSKSQQLVEARLDKIRAETRKLDLETSIKLQEYVKISEVSSTVNKEYNRVRNKVLSLESKLPHVLEPLSLSTASEIKRIIQQEVAEILTELSADASYEEINTKIEAARTLNDSITNSTS